MDKRVILVLFFASFSFAQDASSINCIFTNTSIGYTCNLILFNAQGLDDFASISGTHLEGFTDTDVVYVSRNNGSSPIVPRIICSQFPNTQRMSLSSFGLQRVTNNPFSGCSNLNWLRLYNNIISEIAGNTFASNPLITYIDLDRNHLAALPSNVFNGLSNLITLELRNNPLADIPATTFDPLTSLESLYLNNCTISSINRLWFTNLSQLRFLWFQLNNLTSLEPETFSSLPSLNTLNFDGNQINSIQGGAFRSLSNLTTLNLSNNRLTFLNSDAFVGLPRLITLFLNFNQIEEFPEGIFAPIDNFEALGMWRNRIKTLIRDSFGNIRMLRYLDLDDNVVNGIERSFIDEAEALQTFYFLNNLCASGTFFNFNVNRTAQVARLQRCFYNFDFSVDTVTEGDMNYRFYGFPSPGIVFRVEAPRDVHISLNPVNFEAVPRMEILIGINNNTRSVIRRNGEEDVVSVATPGILNPDSWNGFRIAYANWMLLVFREGDQFPFMVFAMTEFYPMNFYGLRTPGYMGTWSIQPMEADNSSQLLL